MGRPRQKRGATTAEDQWLQKLAAEIEIHRKSGTKTMTELAQAIGISPASLYNYWNGTDFPRPKALQKLKEYGIQVTFKDFEAPLRLKKRRVIASEDEKRQLVFDFLQPLSEKDLEVVSVTPKKPGMVEIRVLLKIANG